MRVNGIEKKTIEVEISPYDVIYATRHQWLMSIRMARYYLEGDKWRENDPYEDRVCNDPIIRNATPEEMAIHLSFKMILEVAKELK